MIETERRFLVSPEWALALLATKPGIIGDIHVQGYIAADDTRTIRVRVENEATAYLTLKGKKDDSGSGLEVEGKIPNRLAASLLGCSLCLGVVNKTRYSLQGLSALKITLDVFTGQNRGLVILEVEGDEVGVKNFVVPSYVTREVTNDHRYSCSQLAQKPFNTWEER